MRILRLSNVTLLIITAMIHAGCRHGQTGQGVVVGKTFGRVDITADPPKIGPEETTTVTVSMSVLGEDNTVEGMSVNLDYQPPLVPEADNIDVYVDGDKIPSNFYHTRIEGGETLTLRIIIDETLTGVDDNVSVVIPFFASTAAMAPVAQRVPMDVDVKVGGSLAPEVDRTEVEVIP